MNFMDLQSFFESSFGQFFTIGIIVVLFLLILVSGRNKETDVKGLALSAVFVALYLALNQVIIFRMPQGGSITAFSMLAITLAGYILGVRRAVMAGMSAGLISLIFNPYVIHPLQLLLDYPLAVGALGFAGIFARGKKGLIGGFFFGAFCRFICTFLSGMIFFGQYAPEGFNPVTWSFYYNLMYIGVEASLTGAVLLLPPVNQVFMRLQSEVQK